MSRDAGVVSHNKVVAARVALLVGGDGTGKQEGAPVFDIPDHAALVEDELAGC